MKLGLAFLCARTSDSRDDGCGSSKSPKHVGRGVPQGRSVPEVGVYAREPLKLAGQY